MKDIEKIEKVYNDTVFRFAYLNKIKAAEAEESFLAMNNFKRPESIEDKEKILEKMSILTEIHEASAIVQKEKNTNKIIDGLSFTLTLVFYTMFLIGSFVEPKVMPFIFIPAIVNIIIILISSKRRKEPYDAFEVANKEYADYEASVKEITKDSFVDYVKENLDKNPDLYKAVIKNTERKRIIRAMPLVILFKIHKITSWIMFALILIPFIDKIANIKKVALPVLIYLNMVMFVINNIIKLNVNHNYKEIIKTIEG